MSDLTKFRDHARAMSTADHRPDKKCTETFRDEMSKWRMAKKYGPGWGEPDELPVECPGCVTEADRALWSHLADEMDAYLSRNVEEGLFA